MLRRRLYCCLLPLVLCWLGITGRSNAEDRLTLKGRLEGAYTRTGSFPFFRIEPTGQGIATHLGKFQFAIPHDVNLSLVPAGGTGTFLLTAANGDTLYGTFLTSATPIPSMPGVLHAIEPMTIVGGTGRFENASGVLVCERFVDVVNLTTTGSFTGTVTKRKR